MKIDTFWGEYAFLSNFHPVEIFYDCGVYPSVEHAYQAAKTLDYTKRVEFNSNITAGQAKRLGRKLVVRADWEDIKIVVMTELVREKFKNPELLKLLMDTGSMELVEGNNWGDTFWGVCNDKGRNELGKILMTIRNENFINQFIS